MGRKSKSVELLVELIANSQLNIRKRQAEIEINNEMIAHERLQIADLEKRINQIKGGEK